MVTESEKNKRLFEDKVDNACVVRGSNSILRTDFLLARPRRANILIAIFLASPPYRRAERDF